MSKYISYCANCGRGFAHDRDRQNHRVGKRLCPSDTALRAHGWQQTAAGLWTRVNLTWRWQHPAPTSGKPK